MSDLRVERWHPNRGINSSDLTDGFQWGLDNLALVMKAFFQRQAGVFRGGRVKQTGVASKNVIVEPLGGLNPSFQPLVLDAEVTLAVPDNASIFSRLDLVSVHLVETDGPIVSRAFWNPSTETAFTQNTVVAKLFKATPVYTVGVASGSPVAQPLPAGHVALATVLVGPGFTSVTDANITRSIAPEPLQLQAFVGVGGANPLPYEPDPVLRLSVRDGAKALIFASVTFNSTNSFNPAAAHKLLEATIEEVGGGTVAMAKHRLFVGDTRTILIAGEVVGPKTLGRYKLKFAEGGGTGTAFGSVNLTDLCLFGAITL